MSVENEQQNRAPHSPPPPSLPPQVWLTFAPVADQSSQYLHVGLQEVNWLSLVFMVVSIPVSFVTTWMLDTLGLRITVRRRRCRRRTATFRRVWHIDL